MEQPQHEEKLNNSLERYQQQDSSRDHALRDPLYRTCSSDSLVNFLSPGSPLEVPVPKTKNRLSLVLCPNGHMTCPTRALWSQEDREEGDCADETSYAHHKLDTAKANKQKTAGSKKVCRQKSQAKTAWIHSSDDDQPVLKISSHTKKVGSLLHSTNHRTPGLEALSDTEMVNSAER